MELCTKLFGSWLLFSYRCFDRIVMSGYLMGMQRCGQLVYWLREVLGQEAIDKTGVGPADEGICRVGGVLHPQSGSFRWNGRNAG